MSVIEFTNVTKRFKKFTAVDNISLQVNQGEIIGFVGPNGAGKTTTISMLLGFLGASDGSIRLHNTEVLPARAHNQHRTLGYAAGDMALFDNLTGAQYLAYFANQYGSKEAQAVLVEALTPKLTVPLKQLSRGNKQKIAIIAALQHQPEVIVLDEPTSGLDPLMQKVFLELILAEKARGATVFMSSHILTEVSEVSDRVIFMREGKIIIDQSMAEVRGKQGKEVTISGIKRLSQDALPKGSTDISYDASSLSFRFSGEPKMLASWLAKQKYADFTVETLTLDKLFEHLYESEGQQ